MTSICLIDTSVFVELLKVPVKSTRHIEAVDLLEQKIIGSEQIFLPMATVIETGNHIGQNGDGRQRRHCAELFVQQVRAALKGESPFKPVSFLKAEAFEAWLEEFSEHATRGGGLGDLSIIHDWRRLCAQNHGRRVYIWSFDQYLTAYDRAPLV